MICEHTSPRLIKGPGNPYPTWLAPTQYIASKGHQLWSFGLPTAAFFLMFDPCSLLTFFASAKSWWDTPAFLSDAAVKRLLPGQVTVRKGELQEDSGWDATHACHREPPNTRPPGSAGPLNLPASDSFLVPQGCRTSKEGTFHVNITTESLTHRNTTGKWREQMQVSTENMT